MLAALGLLGVLILLLLHRWGKRQEQEQQEDAAQALSEDVLQQAAELRRNYLSAFVPAVFADWLIGAHVYALYAARGFSISEIGPLAF